MNNSNDGIFRIDTSDALNLNASAPEIQSINIFALVPEDHPILSSVIPLFDFGCCQVNPSEFASTLVETCKDNKGVVLSANQCGFSHRVFVMGFGDNYVAFFNPVVISMSSDESIMIEGCLSFPLLGLRINRPTNIKVSYQDYFGEEHTTDITGFSARMFLHGLDSLNGITFIHRAKPLALKSGIKKTEKILKKMMGQYRLTEKSSEEKMLDNIDCV